jgi:hypothetical protein
VYYTFTFSFLPIQGIGRNDIYSFNLNPGPAFSRWPASDDITDDAEFGFLAAAKWEPFRSVAQ